jgi:hypothetical protein
VSQSKKAAKPKAKAAPPRKSAFDEGLDAAKDHRRWLEDRLKKMLGETEARIDGLRTDPDAASRRLARAKARREARVIRAGELERLIMDRAARELERGRHEGRAARLARLRALIARDDDRIRALEVERVEADAVLDALQRTADGLRAQLGWEALDAAAAAVGSARADDVRAGREAGQIHRDLFTARGEAGKLDHDGPTAEQIARRGLASRPSRSAGSRLGPDLPDTIRRMVRSGKISQRQAEAAGLYANDHAFGTGAAGLVSSYEVGVQGGGKAGAISVERLEALERWRRAHEALPREFRQVLDSVVIYEVSLDSVQDAELIRYAAPGTNRRTAAGLVLVMALKRLEAWYFGDRA